MAALRDAASGDSRSVADGGILPQSRAQGRDLLRHLLHGGAPLRGSETRSAVNAASTLQLSTKLPLPQRVVIQLEVVWAVQRVDLRLVRREGDVDLLQSLDPLRRQGVADLLESVIRTSCNVEDS